MRLVDPERVAALIRAVAKTAILPHFRNLKPGETTEKGPNDLVTVADVESERLLTAGLLELLPGSTVVGEEAAYADPTVLGRLEERAPVWVIDPVDGTLMFAKGDDRFAVIIALVHQGRTVQGWILDPVGDRMAYAAAGEGAWLDGARLAIAGDRPVSEMVGAIWSLPRVAKRIKPKARKVEPWGSAGRAYMALAEGKLDFLMCLNLKPWDHAAGVLIHAEAGGKAALFDGQDYRPTPMTAPFLVAPGPAGWQALHDLAGEP